MKRFHVHLHVADLGKSIGFYSQLFAAKPTRTESDYAKWMLEDPPVNFAISTRGSQPGIDHLGFQVDDAAELGALKARAEAADMNDPHAHSVHCPPGGRVSTFGRPGGTDMALLDEGETTCCYARSDKHWITDPQGIAWEHFHTLANIPVFREGEAAAAGACCTPKAEPVEAATSACCAPAASVVAAPAGRGKPVGIPVKGSSAGGSCC